MEITTRPFTRIQAKELQNKVVQLPMGNKEDANCGKELKTRGDEWQVLQLFYRPN